MMLSKLVLMLTCGLMLAASPVSAQEKIPRGVIVSKNIEKHAITVRNVSTNKRHTYFLNEKSHISSNGEPVAFEDLAPGQALAMDFFKSDLGREVNFIRIPDLDERLELQPIDSAADYFISGVVTGVRVAKRTVTIHGPKLSQRMTLHIPESVQITENTKPIKLNTLKKGDAVELRYRESAAGYELISGEVTRN